MRGGGRAAPEMVRDAEACKDVRDDVGVRAQVTQDQRDIVRRGAGFNFAGDAPGGIFDFAIRVSRDKKRNPFPRFGFEDITVIGFDGIGEILQPRLPFFFGPSHQFAAHDSIQPVFSRFGVSARQNGIDFHAIRPQPFF